MSEQAGREMDARVAEKVMGWKRVRWCDWQKDTRTSFTYSWHDAVTGKMTELAEDCDDYYDPQGSWSPSTEIAAAWEAVEKFEAMQLFRYTTGRYIACLADGNSLHEGEADTAPLAICLAALKAVGA